MSGSLLVAPAKVNLFLHVLARESSGYHQIETLFQGLELHDRIRIRSRDEPGVELTLASDEDLGPADRNLAVRAARTFRRRAGLAEESGIEIRLEKAIPAGAGLGGGSSDAAAVLRGLADRHRGALDDDELLRLGADLGSDVPFFLGAGPRALAWGRGGRLLELAPLPERPVVVAVPRFRISTADAYRSLDRLEGGGPTRPERPRVLQSDGLSTWPSVARQAANDFEAVVLRAHEQAGRILDALSGAGAAPALLSGSGSALFGVFQREDEAAAAATRIGRSFEGVKVIRTRTLAKWPREGGEGDRS